MGSWIEEFEAHAYWSSLDALDEQIEAASERASSDQRASAQLERYRQVVGEARRRLKGTDPNLVSSTTLNKANRHIAALRTAVEQFRSDGSRTHLDQAQGQLDTLLVYIAQVPVVVTKQDVEAVGDAIVSVRRAAAEHSRYLSEELDKLRSNAESLSASIREVAAALDAQKVRVDQFISQAQTQLTTAENQRTEAFQKSLSQFSERFQQTVKDLDEAATAKFQEQITKGGEQLKQVRIELTKTNKEAEASKKAREEAFVEEKQRWTEYQEESRSTFKELLARSEEQSQQQRAGLDASAKATIEQLAKLKNEAADIVGVIANTGMSGGYEIVADKERTAATNWSRLATFCMFGFVGFAVYAFFRGTTDGFVWGVFFAKMYVSVTFGIFATYAARQSAKHHEGERRARRLQLELASLDPYLESLPEEERHKIKQTLADRMFGRTDEVKPEAEIVSSKSLFDLLSHVVETKK